MTTPRDVALMSMVTLRLDTIGDTCPAWLSGAERKCGRPRQDGYLCSRHARIAERLLSAREAEAAARAADLADKRARLLPEKRARLAEVEAEIARRQPALPSDRAAYTGNVHPSIARRSHLSDANVARMAALHREANLLRAWIGDPA